MSDESRKAFEDKSRNNGSGLDLTHCDYPGENEYESSSTERAYEVWCDGWQAAWNLRAPVSLPSETWWMLELKQPTGSNKFWAGDGRKADYGWVDDWRLGLKFYDKESAEKYRRGIMIFGTDQIIIADHALLTSHVKPIEVDLSGVRRYLPSATKAGHMVEQLRMEAWVQLPEVLMALQSAGVRVKE